MNKELFNSGAMITDRDELYDELEIREKIFEKKSVPIDEPLEAGWENYKKYKHKKHIIKYKTKGRLLEDKVWKLFLTSGMSSMNTRQFILYELKSKVRREIDVLAADEDFVLLIECTTRESPGVSRSLKDKMDKTKSKFEGIKGTIKKLFPNQKPIQLFITENIDWTTEQKKIAKSLDLILINEYMIEYLYDLVEIAGEGAKYQIYGRLLRGKKHLKNLSFTVPAIESRMGGRQYWTFNIEPAKLLKIAYVNKRKDSDFEDLALSYQRVMKPKRIQEIKRYIEDSGFFPNTIIVNFEKPFKNIIEIGKLNQRKIWKEHTRSKPVVITTPEYFGCAWIIDGQHRLYGFADSDLKDYETVPVVAFNEMNDITFEAKVFMDINAKQKAIDANLKWDLYEDLYVDSKDRTESDLYKISVIAKKLNKKGPLRNQIEIPKKSAGGHLTLNYVCGPILRSNLIGITGPFRKDTKADTIEYATKRINVFFKVIKENLPEQWELKKEHFINTGSGMYLFLSLLKDFIPKLIGRPVYDKLNKFEEELYEVLIDMLAYIDGLGKSDIKRFQKASTFANLAPLQEELIEKVFEQRRYDSDLLRNIRERAKEKFKVTTKNQLTKYLDEGESKTFEAKGSISMDIEEFFHSKGKAQVKNDERVNDILFAVASFLNTQGGALAIGILENNRYLKRLEETDLMDFEKANEEYSIIGIDKEAGKFSRGWDELGVYIENKILNQIEPTPHGYFDIKKKNIYRGISSVILSVEAGQTYFYVKNNLKVKSNGQKYDYPTGELFFYRTNTGKQLLQGKELEKYLKDWPR